MPLSGIDFSQHKVFEMFISPEIAKHILEKMNTANRSMSQATVDKYASDMNSGRWMDNEQSRYIAFYEDGTLADSQHRLAAIAKSGIGRVMKIETGLSKAHAYGIDAHRMRKTADQIKIAYGTTWISKTEISVIKMIAGIHKQNKALSPQLVAELCEDRRHELLFIKENLATSLKFVTTAPVKTAIFCAIGHEPESRLAEFCHVLVSGLPESSGDYAAIRLREKLLRDGKSYQSNDTGRKEAVRMTMRAVKKFCERQPIGRLFTPDDYDYEVPEISQ